MIAFKHTSLAISENESQETPQMVTSVHSQTIKKYENNIKIFKLKSAKLNTEVDFEQIDQLLALAKANIAKGSIEQTKEVLSKISSEGKQIQKLYMKSVSRTESIRQNSLCKNTQRGLTA